MTDILVGIFQHSSDYKKLETEIEIFGKTESDYIVYLNNHDNGQYMATVQVNSITEENI